MRGRGIYRALVVAFACEGGMAAHAAGTLGDAVLQTGPRWALGAAQSMDAIVATAPATGDIATLIAELATLDSPQERSAAAARMAPLLAGQGVQQANLTLDGLTSLVVSRMGSDRYVGEPGGPSQHVWLRGFGTSAEQQHDGAYPRYDADDAGVAVGYDIDLGRWNVGAAYAMSQPQVNSHSSLIDDQMNVDTRLIGVYAYWTGEEGWYADVIAAVGVNRNDNERQILFAGIDRGAVGEYDTKYGRLTGALGRVYRLHERLTLVPVVSVGYTYARDPSYTERGAGDLDLHVDDNVSESAVVDVDARFTYAISRSQRVTGHLGAGYRTFTDGAAVNAAFVVGGPTFETEGAPIEPYLIRAGVGYEATPTERLELVANYEYEYRGKFEDNLLSATLRCAI